MKTKVFPKMHVSLFVQNLKESIQFYNRFFHAEPVKIKSGYTKYELETPALIISFVESPDFKPAPFGHLGFQVSSQDEVKAAMAWCKENGLKVTEEFGTNCCHAVQDKFWVTDPNGIEWEVYYFHHDVEFHDPHAEKESPCCTPSEKKRVKLSELGQASCC